MFGKTERKISLAKLTIFVVLLDVFLAAFIFLPSGIDGKIAAAIHGLKIGTDKMGEIGGRIFARKQVAEFEKKSGLSLAGNLEDTKVVADGERGIVLGEEDAASSQPSADESSQAIYYISKKVTSAEILSALDHDLTYEQIAQRGVRRWNLNVGAVNSKKIVDFSIQSRDIGTDSINSRTIKDKDVHSRDLASNIRIRGYFTVERAAYLLGGVEITGDISADMGTITTLDGTTLTYVTANLTTIDLGTNTITDGNFTGDWAWNGGDLSGIDDLYMTGHLGVGAMYASDIGLNSELDIAAGDSGTAVYGSGQNVSGESSYLIRGVMGEGWAAGGGTVDYAIGLEANVGSSAGSTITTGYGLFINTISGTVTNKFALYQEGTGDINYFAGNVGIGTTIPIAALDIQEGWIRTSGAGSNNGIVMSTTDNTTGSYAMANLGSTNNNLWIVSHALARVASRFGLTLGGYTEISSLGSSSNGLVIGTQTSDPLIFGTNNSERMRIDSGGNVGIGTTTPGFKLDIADSTTLRGINIANSTALSYGLYSVGTRYGAYGSDGTTSGYLGYDDTYGLYTANNAYIGGTLTLGGTLTITGNIIPSANDTYTLGDDTHRWSDIFLGGETLHIGTVTGDEGAISYITGNNVLNLQSTGDMALQAASGNVGIGTTTPNQQLEITGNFRLPVTTGSGAGVIYKGADRFIHNFVPSGALGYNTFLGVNSGNFTMSLGGGPETRASYNTAVGVSSLQSLTTGYSNTAIGMDALQQNTTGYFNTAIGADSMAYTVTTGYSNVAVGGDSIYSNTSGYWNTGVGTRVMWHNQDGALNVAMGNDALYTNVSGTSNVAIGVQAMYLATGSNNIVVGYNAGANLTTGSGNIIIGNNIQADSPTADSMMNIAGVIKADLGTGIVNFPTAASFLTTPASSGAVRLPNNQSISWRDSNNTFNASIKFNSNNYIELQSNPGTGTFIFQNVGTNNVDKYVSIGIPHYSSTEEPVLALNMRSDQYGRNFLEWGGGSSSGNAATKQYFYTAATGTTTNGTLALTLDSNQAALFTGNVGIGTTTPGTTLQVSGVITAGNTASTNGPVLMQGYYSNGALSVWGSEYASGAPVTGYAVNPSTSAAGSFLSSTPIAVPRAALAVGGVPGGGGNIVFYTGASQTVAVGSPVTMSPVMTILNGGNVGIGTTTPGTNFQVGGDFNTGTKQGIGFMLQGTNSGGSMMQFQQDGIDTWSFGMLPGQGRFSIFNQRGVGGSAGTEMMTITTGGNIGIGTTTPGFRLDVQNTAASMQVKSTSATSYAYIDIVNTNGGLVRIGREGSGAGGLLTGDTAYAGIINSQGTYPFQIGVNNSVAMTILNGGNVGIGTTTPSSLFYVRSAANPTFSYSSRVGYYPANSQVIISRAYTGGDNYSGVVFHGIQSDATDAYAYVGTVSSASGYSSIIVMGQRTAANEFTERMRIDQSGNVGIGTTTPNQVLDVIGTIQASNLLGGALNITTDASGNIIRDPSDRRLKEDIQTVTNPLDKVMRLRGVTYKWKDKEKMGSQTDYGLIAQEVAEVTPELTATSADGIMGVKYTNMMGLVVGAIQEQQGEISQQSSQISEISDSQLPLSDEIANLNDQSTSLNDKLKIIGNTLESQEISINKAKTDLEDFEKTFTDYQTEANNLFASLIETDKLLTDRITSLEDKIATLSVSDGGEIPASVVTQDTQGNVILAGIFKAKDVQAEAGSFKGALTAGSLKAEEVESEGIVAGAFAVKSDADSEKKDTIGSGKILEVKNDDDDDGIDDDTGSDGKSVAIKNSTVKKDSKIFVTSRTMLDQPLVVTKIKDGESFTVEKKSPTNQDIEFDWWIIGSE